MIVLSLLLDILCGGFLTAYWRNPDSKLFMALGIAIFLTFIIYVILNLHKEQQGAKSNRAVNFIQMLIVWLSIGVFVVNQSWALYVRIIAAIMIVLKWLFTFKGDIIPPSKPKNFRDNWLSGMYLAFALAPMFKIVVGVVGLWIYTVLFVLAGMFTVYRARLKKANIPLICELLLLLIILYVSGLLEVGFFAETAVVIYILSEWNDNVSEFILKGERI